MACQPATTAPPSPAPGVFDHVYDVTREPLASAEQQAAAITQLFYGINWLHDWWYDSGFNEAAGNAQTSQLRPRRRRGRRAARRGSGRRLGGSATTPTCRPRATARRRACRCTCGPAPTIAVLPAAVGHAGDPSRQPAFGPKAYDLTATVVFLADGGGVDRRRRLRASSRRRRRQDRADQPRQLHGRAQGHPTPRPPAPSA
jgi:hypothetical protein